MEFLETMSKLRSSLDYFEKSNPQSIELENIKALYETGGDALNREFGEMLKKHSLPTQGVELLNSISMPEEAVEVASIQHFPEDIQTSLSSIGNLMKFLQFIFTQQTRKFEIFFGLLRCLKKLGTRYSGKNPATNARSNLTPDFLFYFAFS